MFLFITFVAIGFLIRSTLRVWRQVDAEVGRMPDFSSWLIRGAVAPLCIWIFYNSGLFLPPLTVDIDVAKAAGNFWPVFGKYLYAVVWIVGVCWGAMSFVLVLVRLLPHVERRPFFVCAGFWSFGLSPVILFLVIYQHWVGLIFFAVGYFWLMSRLAFPMLKGLQVVRPNYGTALTRLNMGRFDEAELEIVEQLEKSEADYEGWMMLAKLYATRDRDVVAAEKAIFGLCEQRKLSAAEVALAMNKLADWHLSIADDPEAARRVLAEIWRRFPGTEVAEHASIRSARIPPTREEWIEYKRTMPPRFLAN